jgi:hypothetical protein
MQKLYQGQTIAIYRSCAECSIRAVMQLHVPYV